MRWPTSGAPKLNDPLSSFEFKLSAGDVTTKELDWSAKVPGQFSAGFGYIRQLLDTGAVSLTQ